MWQLLLLDGNKVVANGFRRFPLSLHAKEHGLDEDLAYWYTLELGPALRARGDNLSVLALFDNGEFLELKISEARRKGKNKN